MSLTSTGFGFQFLFFWQWYSVDNDCRSKVSSPRSLILNLRFIHPISCLFTDKILFLWYSTISSYSSLSVSLISLPVDPNHSFLHLKWRKAIFVYSHNLSIVPGGDSLWTRLTWTSGVVAGDTTAVLTAFCSLQRDQSTEIEPLENTGGDRREVRGRGRVYMHAQ